MKILKHWKREPPKRARRTMVDLTPKQQACVRQAVRFLRRRYGTSEALAGALGVSRTLVAQSAGSYAISINLALRVARLASVPIDDILSGAWPTPRQCPTCGHDWDR